jgi:hypothetical protein
MGVEKMKAHWRYLIAPVRRLAGGVVRRKLFACCAWARLNGRPAGLTRSQGNRSRSGMFNRTVPGRGYVQRPERSTIGS